MKIINNWYRYRQSFPRACNCKSYFKKILETISEFGKEHSTVQTYLNAIFISTKCLMESELIQTLLSLVLVLGNHLNSQKRGLTYGFKIESIKRIASAKSKNFPGVNLMHVIAHYMLAHYSHLLETLPDFDSLESACQISINEINQSLSELFGQFSIAKTELDRRLKNG